MTGILGGLIGSLVVIAPGYWLARVGQSSGTFYDNFTGVAANADGIVWTSGETASGGTPNAASLTNFNASGIPGYDQRIRTATQQEGRAVGIDSSNNSYLLGRVDATNNPAMVSKYNATGTLQWQRQVNASSTNNFSDLAVTAAGDAYIPSHNGNMIKINTSGTTQWAIRMDPVNGGGLRGVALDSSENIYLSSNPTLNTRGAFNISKWTPAGAITWERNLTSTTLSITAGHIATDSTGAAYVIGQAADRLVLAKYSTAGGYSFARQLSTTVGTNNSRYGIAVDSSDFVYIAGASGATRAIQLAKYNSSGQLQWQRTMSGPNNMDVNKLFIDSNNNLYIAAETANEAFLAKIPTDGSLTGTYLLGGLSITYAASSLTSSSATLSSVSSGLKQSDPSVTNTAGTATVTTLTRESWRTRISA